MKGGTPNFSKPSLCNSCTHFHHRETSIGEVRLCSATSGSFSGPPSQVPEKVYECSDYRPKNRPTLSQMERDAMILVRKGDKLGFVKSDRFRQDNGLDKFDELVNDVSVKHS